MPYQITQEGTDEGVTSTGEGAIPTGPGGTIIIVEWQVVEDVSTKKVGEMSNAMIWSEHCM